MKHFGDITKINGANVPLVDIITGGSPCQDLSVAGKRAGLSGERSGLFMEQIRIVKEMRDECARQIRMRGADVDIRLLKPRFMVWENVPGAFSSNKGEDFRCVLEEICRVADQAANVPLPEKGKWSTSGCIMGDSWSIAWRVHDAQFWGRTIRDSRTGNVLALGTPQRRRRIALVADFGGVAAPKILFERESLSGNSEKSGDKRKDSSTITTGNIAETISFQERSGKPGEGKGILIQNEHTGALSTLNNQSVVYGICSNNSNSMKSSNPFSGIYEADTSRTLDLNGGSPACNQGGMAVVYDASRRHDYQPFDDAYCIGNGQLAQARLSNKVGTLNCMHDQQAVITYGTYQNITGTVDACIGKGTSNQLANQDMFIANASTVRRLTPLECERLQGFPDHWTNIGEWVDSKGKKHKDSDSPRYKALGNSIALPFWQWMAERMVQYIDHDPTMASLFDGIGGFPLVFSRCGCSPVWASEIEEFPIAVTKLRFGGD